MEKISGIIPASKRITTVDAKNLTPVRPGAPGFGRPDGSSEITDRVTLSSAARIAGEAEIAPNYKMPKELFHREIADRMADDFFTGQANSAPVAVDTVLD